MVTRITGCPNGCARTYMAEIGFVGSGPLAYQLWLGGSHNQTRTATEYEFRVKLDNMEELLTRLFTCYKAARTSDKESFGDFCYRAGKDELKNYVDHIAAGEDDKAEEVVTKIKAMEMPEAKWAKDFIGGVPDIEYAYN